MLVDRRKLRGKGKATNYFRRRSVLAKRTPKGEIRWFEDKDGTPGFSIPAPPESYWPLHWPRSAPVENVGRRRLLWKKASNG